MASSNERSARAYRAAFENSSEAVARRIQVVSGAREMNELVADIWTRHLR